MSCLNSPSQTPGQGNEEILEGIENVSQISDSKDYKILAHKTKLLMSNASDVKIETQDSSLCLANGTKASITGDSNVVFGADISGLLVHGSNSLLTAHKMEDLVWSGSHGQCQLSESERLNVYGKYNQIAGQTNSKMLICGDNNVVMAKQTNNLKVRGHMNQVIATRTCNVVVDGHENRVQISDISTSHLITKASPGILPGFSFSIPPENQINFCGVLTDSSIFTGYVCPPAMEMNNSKPKTFFPASRCVEPKTFFPLCVDDRFLSNKKYNVGYDDLALPQIHIRYVDHAQINRYSYNLGIFHFNVEGMSLVHYSHSPVKVNIMVDELDEGSYTFRISCCEKMAMFTGSKNGARETLRLTGNRITENPDNSFYVHFELLEEDVVGEGTA